MGFREAVKMRITKENGVPALLGSIVAIIPLLGVIWFVVKPVLRDSIGVAMADEIKQTVQQEVAPIRGGISVIIQSNIVKLKKDIAQLQRLQAADPQKWTSEQANELVEKQTELEAQQMALSALK
jgi:sensor domain CHASE-containing protein